MNNTKCKVCRQPMPTLKFLKSHYLAAHSKQQLVRTLLKSNLHKCTTNLNRNKRKHTVSFVGVSPNYLKTETLYLQDTNFVILTNGNTNSKIYEKLQLTPCNGSVVSAPSTIPRNEFIKAEDTVSCSDYFLPEMIGNRVQTSDATESSDTESEIGEEFIKEALLKIKRHSPRGRKRLKRLKSFRFSKRTLDKPHHQSLNEKTGRFYVCHCMEHERSNEVIKIYQKNDLHVLESDTESCSDTGKNAFLPIVDLKFYCYTCGNGYKTKKKLVLHLKLHETKCGVCNEVFNSPEAHKKHLLKHLLKVFVCHLCKEEFAHKYMLLDHLDAHMEDEIYENVFSLEDDYKIKSNTANAFINTYDAYNAINYAKNFCNVCPMNNANTYMFRNEHYFNDRYLYKYEHIFCAFCFAEFLSLKSYEDHLRVHF